jgi:hypothetical protein
MRVISLFFVSIFVYYVLFSISCSNPLSQNIDEELISLPSDSVDVSFDIHSDFEGTSMKIWINDRYVFSDSLSTNVSLAGPLVCFSLKMKRGTNEIYVNWIDNKTGLDYIKTKVIILKSAEKYFIILEKTNYTIRIIVRDYPFLYA